jgi:TRAP-type C4-dicarboxylate transport system substrate-binding protein
MKLPVYSRAGLSRTVALVGALLLTAVSTSAVARVSRAADTWNQDYPTVQALRSIGSVIKERGCGRDQVWVFHSHQLAEEMETIKHTRAGAIDGNRTNVALIGRFLPAKNVAAMPWLFRSIEHLQNAPDDLSGNEILNCFEPYQHDSAIAELIERIRKVE